MRLRKIKLAGFKSFVDPTIIDVPARLTGVVGPNGCGKSNIIDAVRWVMGEISAKHLRGDSMADVVFSGAGSRKPLGQASVELVFDNTDGRLGGQFASYAEISVKRLVTRDAAQSHYYLNGTRCRRRDVTDMFHGTGLGPRSYAIIEQGMISRLIEAKPEELREFLEEAAGISKYKERRRETQNRMSRAQENLDRLNDLRDELEQRLQHLQRQAAMAEKYKVLKAEERTLKAELLTLRWLSLDEAVRTESSSTRVQETALQAAIADQRSLENTIESDREVHTAANEEFNEIYRRDMEASAEIARLEESIQHLKGRQVELKEQIQREYAHREDARRHLGLEQAELDELNQMLAKEQPELERLKQVEAGSKAELSHYEEGMQVLQGAWDELNQRAAGPAEVVFAERARSAQLEGHRAELFSRIAKLADERGAIRPTELKSEVAEREAAVAESRSVLDGIEASLQEKQESISRMRQGAGDAAERVNDAQAWYQQTQGKLASLQRLQQEALGKGAQAASAWLGKRGLKETPRLAENIEVEKGWEAAVEMVLGPHLESVCVSGGERLYRELGKLEQGSLGFFDTTVIDLVLPSTHHASVPLLAKVQAPGTLETVLVGIYVVDSIEQGLQRRGRLRAGESFVTREGVWIGKNWIRVARAAGEGTGILSREQELKQLTTDAERAQSEVERWQALALEFNTRLGELEDEPASLRKQFADKHRELTNLHSALSVCQTEFDQSQERASTIAQEVSELEAQTRREQEQLAQAREQLERSQSEAEQLTAERDGYAEQRQDRRRDLESARERWQAVQEDIYDVGVRAESMRTKLASLHAGMARNREQLERIELRCAELEASQQATEPPLAQANTSLQDKLKARREVASELDLARTQVEEVDARLRELEQRRGPVETRVDQERSKLDELKMQAQETLVRRATVEEQLAGSGHELQTILAQLAEDASEAAWEEEVARMERRINRLGAINLAAIEEYEQESERKSYLDSQYEDLVEALETLDQAIRKIDRETRARFKDTYEKVNAGLADMFPRLFGGGTAFLQMTGEDLLSTGISVVARPPGKRNTSIHLLSGGEKALAAIALVFAIFELNPAPFCLLDEVDAPLDDANVGRFCDLVKSMTERIQFLVVTHNKATMEVTQHLIGVTMSEPGISRLVAVDVEEAAKLAAV